MHLPLLSICGALAAMENSAGYKNLQIKYLQSQLELAQLTLKGFQLQQSEAFKQQQHRVSTEQHTGGSTWANAPGPAEAIHGSLPTNATCPPEDELCHRLQRLEPTLPLRAPIDAAASTKNACRDGQCFPLVHVLGAYHAFLEETLGTGLGSHGAQLDGLLSGHPMVEMQHRCHNEVDGGGTFGNAGGGAAFLNGWGGGDKLLIAECMTGMMWYPNLAGRWSREWSAAYWPCKAEAIKGAGK